MKFKLTKKSKKNSKNRRIKKILIIVLIIILVSTLLVTTVFASVRITTRNTTHWFYKLYLGSWGTLKTPRFYNRNYPSQEFYCIQAKKDFPASTYYNTSNVIGSYSTRVKTGLQIILQNGYPYNYMGLNKEQARYITANAIRSWLSENNISYQYDFMDLGRFSDSQLRYYANRGEIPGKIRANGYNSMLRKMVDLLILARNQSSYRVISMTTPTMTKSGSYFVGTARVNLTRLNQGYTINTSSLPSGSLVTGYTGNNGDNLTIKIPANSANANKSFSLSVTGRDYRNMVSLFAYSPSSSSQSYYQTMLGSNSAWYTVSKAKSVTLKTPILPKADLIVSSVTTNKSTYNYGNTITVYVTVKNTKGQNSTGFYVSLSSTLGVHTKYISSLNVGSSKTVSFTYTAPRYSSNTSIKFTAKADHYNHIPESNEYNNTRSRTVTVYRALPDLVVSSLTTSKSTYSYSETITVTAKIQNNGNYGAGSFYVKLSSSLGTSTSYVSSLGVGASKTIKFTYTAPVYGSNKSITFTAVADYTSRVKESNESNNTRTKSITIRRALPDLVVTSLTTSKQQYDAGDTILITATVRNIGSYNASSSLICLTIDNLGSFVASVGSLSPNQQRNISFITIAPTSKSHLTLQMTAIADYNNAIFEISESNNQRTGMLYINAIKPDLTIINSTIQNWYANKKVCVSATISNLTIQDVPNVPVTLKIGNNTYTEYVCVKGNGTNLVVFVFTTPIADDYTIELNVDPGNSVHEIDESNNTLSKEIEILNFPQSYVIDPDDENMEQRYDAYGIVSVPTTNNSDYHTWQEVRYISGSYITKSFYAHLTTTFTISPDVRLSIVNNTMGSGYGISCVATTVLTTNYDAPEKLVGIQNAFVYYPESTYGQNISYESVRSDLDIKSGAEGETSIIWHYRVNPYSTTNSRLHYTPLFFPDGQYIVLSQAFYAWSPIGQMYKYDTNSILIDGDMYDRITNVKR